MGGKRIRSRNAQNSISVSNLSTRSTINESVENSNLSRGKLPEDLLNYTKDQLKAECRKRGQKTSGTKIELLQRLGYKMSVNAKTKEATANGSTVYEINSKKGSFEVTTGKHKKHNEKTDRQGLVLWRRPIRTIEYFFREILVILYVYGNKLLQFKKTVLLLAIIIVASTVVSKAAGPHQVLVQQMYKTCLWCFYWVGLGILSSVGLGTGLHTFLLYLGPHIAQVTLAAYECGSLNFPEPPYPDDIECPTEVDSSQIVSIWSIMSKVRLEAMCWGAGTALGELPPYFMARAARLSGYDPEDDDDLREFEELQRKEINHENLTIVERGKLFVEHVVQKVGFLGILACASIPNPLFDLAGITCGHFLVPFWTFFGATLIGKAIIKMHIQKLFVIIAFNETLINTALEWLTLLPLIGVKLQEPFKAFLTSQKLKLHRQKGSPEIREKGSLLSSIFEKFVVAMILYFVVSIVNSLAQSYHKRLHKKNSSKLARSD